MGRLHTLTPLAARRKVPRAAPLARAVDVVAGTALLLLCGPLIAVIAIAVRVSSYGPVLHREPVVDSHGRAGNLLSFRTMVDGAGTDAHQRLRAVIGAADADHHYTGIGRLLERSRLDRLPRLVNVVGGTASLLRR